MLSTPFLIPFLLISSLIVLFLFLSILVIGDELYTSVNESIQLSKSIPALHHCCLKNNPIQMKWVIHNHYRKWKNAYHAHHPLLPCLHFTCVTLHVFIHKFRNSGFPLFFASLWYQNVWVQDTHRQEIFKKETSEPCFDFEKMRKQFQYGVI